MKLFFIYISAIVFFLTKVQANIVVLPEAMYSFTTPTAKIDNYLLQHQRQFEQQMNILEKYLEDFRKKFDIRLEMIGYYDAIVDAKLEDMKDKLDPLEILGDINYFCVKKYRGKLPIDIVLKENLKTCIKKAKTAYTTLQNNPENTLKNIKNHYNNNFLNTIKECKRKFQNDEIKYHNCAVNAIKTTTNYFTTNSNTFYSQISTAECSSTTKIDEAFDCYSVNIFNTFTAIGEVNGLVENCLAGYEYCLTYDSHVDDDLAEIKGPCPYQMAWHLADDDLTAEKIVNPFKGFNTTMPCLQVNFITNHFSQSVKKM